jgi:type II secretory pathway component PulF
MPAFRCSIADRSGKVSALIRIAEDENEVVRSFAGGESYLISVEQIIEKRSSAKRRRSEAAVLEFTEMMGLLVEAGLSLKDALELAGAMRTDGSLRALSDELLTAVRKGSSFARAVENAGELFPPIYRGMVAVGDRVGSVERIFPRLASYLKERKALREKIAGALAYPLLVLAISLIGTVGIVIFLLPRLESIFAGFGGTASVNLRANVRVMNGLLISFAVFTVIAFAALMGAVAARRKNAAFALAIDRLTLRIPYLGAFIVALETLNFSFAMETLVSGGVPIEAAIAEAASVVGNRAYKDAVVRSRSAVLRGEPVSEAFAECPELPLYLSRWIAVGERSGQTEKVFAQIRTYFQGEVDRRTQRFMALVEPALIVLVGLILLTIVLLFIVPLFSMYGSLL